MGCMFSGDSAHLYIQFYTFIWCSTETFLLDSMHIESYLCMVYMCTVPYIHICFYAYSMCVCVCCCCCCCAFKMAQASVYFYQPDGLSSFSETHMAKGENWFSQVVLWPLYVCHGMNKCVHTHKIQCKKLQQWMDISRIVLSFFIKSLKFKPGK